MTTRRKAVKQARRGTHPDEFEQAKTVRQMAGFVRWFIGAVVFLLGGTFTLAKLRGLPVVKVSSDDWARFFVQAALVIYFWSYIFGSRSDLNAQESVTREMLVGKKQILSLLGWCVILVVVFAALWRIHTFAMFSIALITFMVVDLVLGKYFYRRVLRPQFQASRKRFVERDNPAGALDVDIVNEFMSGRWRDWRQGFALAWALLFLVIDATALPKILADWSGMFSPDSLLALSVLVLVLIVEMWMWAFRVKRKGQQLLLARLKEKFGRHGKLEL